MYVRSAGASRAAASSGAAASAARPSRRSTTPSQNCAWSFRGSTAIASRSRGIARCAKSASPYRAIASRNFCADAGAVISPSARPRSGCGRYAGSGGACATTAGAGMCVVTRPTMSPATSAAPSAVATATRPGQAPTRSRIATVQRRSPPSPSGSAASRARLRSAGSSIGPVVAESSARRTRSRMSSASRRRENSAKASGPGVTPGHPREAPARLAPSPRPGGS